MAILEQPTFPSLEGELMCSAQACPASQVPLPGSEEARAMTVGSGQQLSMLFETSSPLGVFSKILLESSHWTNSEEFSYVWNRLDTRFALSAFQLTPLGESIEDNGSLLWRTPNGSDVTGGPMNGERRLAQGHQLNLADQAATPKLWPTPTWRDWKSTSHGTQPNARPLSEVAGLSSDSPGSLNPRFVEELMGFPIDHTALKPSETPSSPSKLTRSSRRSPKLKKLA